MFAHQSSNDGPSSYVSPPDASGPKSLPRYMGVLRQVSPLEANRPVLLSGYHWLSLGELSLTVLFDLSVAWESHLFGGRWSGLSGSIHTLASQDQVSLGSSGMVLTLLPQGGIPSISPLAECILWPSR